MYYVRTLTIRFVDDDERHIYGIDMVDGSGTVLESATEVTEDWRLISQYVLWMNRQDLEAERFWDVVEDIRRGGAGEL